MNPHPLQTAAGLLFAALAALASPAAMAADTPIYTLQGSGAKSAYAGQAITTTGVVTVRTSNGFFIQDPAGDGNDQTSDGVFVFSTTYKPNVGDMVRVAGTLVEFNVGSASNAATLAAPLTEISTVTAVTTLSTGHTITPLELTLPLAAGDGFERFEGMLVRIGTPMTVQQNYFQARYGQLSIGVGRLEQPTNRYRAGTADALALAAQQARSLLLLDDGSSAQNISPLPNYAGNGVPRAGDLVSNLVGAIDFGPSTASTAGAALYRLQPAVTPTFTVGNARPAAPPVVGGNVRVGSMNVLNFFSTFTNGQNIFGQIGQGCALDGSVSASNCRGADNLTEYQRQRSKIVKALAGLNADAVGLMEIQNDDGTALNDLVATLNAAYGSNVYAGLGKPAAGSGTDAIRVALIYKPAKLTPVGNPQTDMSAINDRPPLMQTFQAANGERVTVVVNHLKSKGSCPSSGAGNVDAGDGQGCWNAKRVQQAQQLRSFIAAQQSAGNASSDVILIGDFNAYAMEDPMHDLASNGWVDQAGRFSSLAYSYVFDSLAGRLDHAIASASLSAKVVRAEHWHINADEGQFQDYNLEFKQPACSTCAADPYDGTVPFRSSDHDPVLIGLALYKTFTGTIGRDTIVGTTGDDIIIGAEGADTLTGNGGSNIYVYRSLRDAGDTVTDFNPLLDVIDLRPLMTALGYAGTDPFADGWARLVAVTGGYELQVDADGPSGTAAYRVLATLMTPSARSMVTATRNVWSR